VISTGQDRFETQHRRKDGSSIDVEISAQFTEKAGGQFFVFIRDITEKKCAEREREKLASNLRQSQKMEAVGTLAGGIAHDFNNILGAIIGYSDMAMDSISEDNPAHECIEQVLEAGNRARDMVQRILAFSRKSESSRAPVDLFTITADALKLLRATIPSTIEIRKILAAGKSIISADATEIHQVLMNLCANASQAMEDSGGVLTVSLNRILLDEQTVGNEVDIMPGPYFELSVQDTGIGIEPEIIDRIFDPFFTTKAVDKGTGMGLAVVHGIVKSHGGMIAVENTLGAGACFKVYLPECDSTLERSTIPFEMLPSGTERVLLVDDEASLVRITQRQLERLGYRVAGFSDPKAALDLFQKDPRAFDIVVTDQTMPKITGEQLAGEIFRIRPDMPIVLCTGYSSKIDKEKSRAKGIRAFAMKPILRQDLAVIVRAALDEENR
jgi:signal transduction histidine kinase/ActR/RegA family two-component response regulator